MTATELKELMDGVPMTAWPEGVRFEVGKTDNADGTDPMDLPMFVLELDGLIPDGYGDSWERDQEVEAQESCDVAPWSCPLPVHQASLMFIGSMIANLPLGYVYAEVEGREDGNYAVIEQESGEEYGAETPLKALARAWRSINGRD